MKGSSVISPSTSPRTSLLKARELTAKAKQSNLNLQILSSPPSEWTVFSSPSSSPKSLSKLSPNTVDNDNNDEDRNSEIAGNSDDFNDNNEEDLDDSMPRFRYDSFDKIAIINQIDSNSNQLHQLCASDNPSLDMIKM
jgi:hypothetical protein